MTMVPAENISKQNHLLPHGGGVHGGFDFNIGLMRRLRGYVYDQSEACLGSDLDANYYMDCNQGEEDRDHEGWLQLSIGGHGTTRRHHNHRRNKHARVDLAATRGRGSTELHLFLGGASSQQERPHDTVEFQEINREFRPTAAAHSSYFARPFQVQPEPDVPGPNSDVRIIDPPRRPHSGIWFMLQASENQEKEPFLPQIPKSYLRIKDEKITVLSVMKYLVNKLRLDSESEVEIRCRGKELEHSLTLQHVRDQTWSISRNHVVLLPHTSMPPHHLDLDLMLLHYSRKA